MMRSTSPAWTPAAISSTARTTCLRGVWTSRLSRKYAPASKHARANSRRDKPPRSVMVTRLPAGPHPLPARRPQLRPVARRVPQVLLDAQQLVVLGHPVGAARRARLDLAGV